ncbi:MAG: acyltransferase family protein [Xanthomonadales bacterium]|nr:acyltransferase family protein [Xanthomonadales bacterium]
MDYAPSRTTSSAIILIRPLLILLMMLAHLFVLDHASVMKSEMPLSGENWLIVFLKSALARSGVPLLSLISGYLAVYSFQNYGYFSLLLKKARRLLWPMIWANLLFIVLFTWPGQAADPGERPDLAIYPFNLYGWFQATFAFYKLPANQPLFFLKDLFTCFLLLPLLLAAARIKYLNIMVFLWMAYKCVYLKSVFILPVYPLWFFRFDVVFAFYGGILLALNHKALVIENRQISLALLLLFLLACVLASAAYVVLPQGQYVTLFLWLNFLVKVVSVFGCVALMGLLSKQSNFFTRGLRRLSPYAYALFLTHALSFTFFDRAYRTLFGTPEFFALGGNLYLVGIFISAVLVAIVAREAWLRLVSIHKTPRQSEQ